MTGRILCPFAGLVLACLLTTSSAFGATIGLDGVHGPLGTSDLTGPSAFLKMYEELQSAGYTLRSLPDFDPATLATCDAIFLLQPRDTHVFTTSDMASIQSYVAGGGGLLALAEGGYSSDSTVSNYNQLLAPYGVEVNSSATSGSGHVISGFVLHPVTDGITSLGVDYQRRLVSMVFPAIDLTLGGGEDDMLAAVDGVGGAGNVVVMSDSSTWGYPADDTNLYDRDNLQLLMNISEYLTTTTVVPEPATLSLLALGALAVFRRR